jgi:hypothetical protein
MKHAILHEKNKKNLRRLIGITVFLSFIFHFNFFAYSDNTTIKKIQAKLPKLSEHVDIIINPLIINKNYIIIKGYTNLPIHTTLMLSVKEKRVGGFYGSSRTKVKGNGVFESERFGPRGGLKKGEYEINITVPYAFTQPKSVKSIIGNKGEKLKGKIVNSSNKVFGKTVEKTILCTIGGNVAKSLQKKRALSGLKKYKRIYKAYQSLYNNLAIQRKLQKTKFDIKRWHLFCLNYQNKLRELRKEIDKDSVTSPGACLRGAGSVLSVLPLCIPEYHKSQKKKRLFSKNQLSYKEYMRDAHILIVEIEKDTKQ